MLWLDKNNIFILIFMIYYSLFIEIFVLEHF